MCLQLGIDHKKQIAVENMSCYKSLDRGAKSQPQGYVYKKGEIQTPVTLIITPRYGYDRIGKRIKGYSIWEGYHSRNETSISKKSHLFIIPKGAGYIVGGENSDILDNYVSTSIIYVGRNNWWNRYWQGKKYGVIFKKY